jgi:hypothetical protein
VTSAVGLPIAPAAPGIYGVPGNEPRQANALHYSSYATGVVSVDGSPTPGDIVTITIEGRPYNYTVTVTDSLYSIRDALVALINGNSDEKVVAIASSQFTRIILRYKTPGTAGDGLPISATAVGQTVTSTSDVVTTSSPSETMTAINSTLCCANITNAPVTMNNPAVPGEIIIVYASGIGLVGPEAATVNIQDGVAYPGPELNYPEASISAIIGGSTANVLSAGLQVGAIGMYTVMLQLANSLSTNATTQLTISQNIYTSNIVTIAVVSPTQSAAN